MSSSVVMGQREDWDTALLVLRAATQLVDSIQAGAEASGFTDVRPVHGFAFARIAAGGATVVELARHLGVTKQAASQLADVLVRRGYVTRTTDHRDGRIRRLRLTARGVACTRAAEEAAGQAMRDWRLRVGDAAWGDLRSTLGAVCEPGPLRPAW